LKSIFVFFGIRGTIEGSLFPANVAVCLRGKWAEIAKDETIKIGGFDVEFKSNGITVGCQSFNNYIVTGLRELASLCKTRDVSIEINNEGHLIYVYNWICFRFKSMIWTNYFEVVLKEVRLTGLECSGSGYTQQNDPGSNLNMIDINSDLYL
jgi:hypothetical protein